MGLFLRDARECFNPVLVSRIPNDNRGENRSVRTFRKLAINISIPAPSSIILKRNVLTMVLRQKPGTTVSLLSFNFAFKNSSRPYLPELISGLAVTCSNRVST